MSHHDLWMELGANAKPGVQNPNFSSKKYVYCLLVSRGKWPCLREALGRQGRRALGRQDAVPGASGGMRGKACEAANAGCMVWAGQVISADRGPSESERLREGPSSACSY